MGAIEWSGHVHVGVSQELQRLRIFKILKFKNIAESIKLVKNLEDSRISQPAIRIQRRVYVARSTLWQEEHSRMSVTGVRRPRISQPDRPTYCVQYNERSRRVPRSC